MKKSKKTSTDGPRGSRTLKSLDCKYCGESVNNVDINATGITCSKCVSQLCSGIQPKKVN